MWRIAVDFIASVASAVRSLCTESRDKYVTTANRFDFFGLVNGSTHKEAAWRLLDGTQFEPHGVRIVGADRNFPMTVVAVDV